MARLKDWLSFGHGARDPSSVRNLEALSTEQLLALMRHEAHRIEKTIYNDILETNYQRYRRKWERVGEIFPILRSRGVPEDEATVAWAREIYDAFDDLEHAFIQPNSEAPRPFVKEQVEDFVELVRSRRSVRVWADVQPSAEELERLARQLIDAARWAPTSGNRQPWRFKILLDQDRKELLRGLKEQHCISAPLLIFVGMDTRVYGALGRAETGTYIDAGAAIMQMVLAAHSGGYGVCWNHFARDLVVSRRRNVGAYRRFASELGIPDYVTPIAIVAVGRPRFIPPVPARTSVEDLLIPDS
jgi:nitroreductase